ncbi:MAG: hypothetical protein JRI23_22265 [Deltaproteobacteria bacterium]|jgi:hypothetical protein|nr:hypothetical protein [Deltaproteobacteria bacterium]MBW2534671.1 hypothetical protein [Deltaproteobacteria bacterium]
MTRSLHERLAPLFASALAIALVAGCGGDAADADCEGCGSCNYKQVPEVCEILTIEHTDPAEPCQGVVAVSMECTIDRPNGQSSPVEWFLPDGMVLSESCVTAAGVTLGALVDDTARVITEGTCSPITGFGLDSVRWGCEESCE